MPQCFTCGQEITFDKNIRSKTGKQIPLWIDKQNTHSHDDNGQPIRSPLPTGQQQQQVQTTTNTTAGAGSTIGYQTKSQPLTQNTTTSTNTPIDNPSLEAVLLNQLSQKLETIKKVMEDAINEKLNQIYEQANQNRIMLESLVAHHKLTEPTTADKLFKKDPNDKSFKIQQPPQVQGWNSVPNSDPFPKEENPDEDKIFTQEAE